MKSLVLVAIFMFFLRDVWAGPFDLVRDPEVGECFPFSAGSKKYLKVEERFLYTRKVFTCEYVCQLADGNFDILIGTSDLTDWWQEDGKTFVCDGYRENMLWINTPEDSRSWGYWELGGVSPFHPLDRKIPELKDWYRSRIQ